jgi:uncharacterized protein YndB with AHSA1/START domain
MTGCESGGELMKGTAFKVIVGIAAIVLVVLIAGMLSPKDFKIEREIIIDKPKAEVFLALRSLKQHQLWNPWLASDPNAVVEYQGADNVIGSTSTWKGNKDVGAGEQEIKNIVDGERIDIELRFSEPMEDTNQSYLLTQAIDDTHTLVKWGMTGENQFPGNLIFTALDLRTKLDGDFGRGLKMLKAELEK